MAAYRRVYDSHHLQADCQEPGSSPEPYAALGNRVRATFFTHIRIKPGTHLPSVVTVPVTSGRTWSQLGVGRSAQAATAIRDDDDVAADDGTESVGSRRR